MTKERIYELRLDIKNPDLPFAIERSIAVSSGDLIQVFSKFQLDLVKLLRDLHEEEMDEARANLMEELGDNDIPF